MKSGFDILPVRSLKARSCFALSVGALLFLGACSEKQRISHLVEDPLREKLAASAQISSLNIEIGAVEGLDFTGVAEIDGKVRPALVRKLEPIDLVEAVESEIEASVPIPFRQVINKGALYIPELMEPFDDPVQVVIPEDHPFKAKVVFSGRLVGDSVQFSSVNWKERDYGEKNMDADRRLLLPQSSISDPFENQESYRKEYSAAIQSQLAHQLAQLPDLESKYEEVLRRAKPLLAVIETHPKWKGSLDPLNGMNDRWANLEIEWNDEDRYAKGNFDTLLGKFSVIGPVAETDGGTIYLDLRAESKSYLLTFKEGELQGPEMKTLDGTPTRTGFLRLKPFE